MLDSLTDLLVTAFLFCIMLYEEVDQMGIGILVVFYIMDAESIGCQAVLWRAPLGLSSKERAGCLFPCDWLLVVSFWLCWDCKNRWMGLDVWSKQSTESALDPVPLFSHVRSTCFYGQVNGETLRFCLCDSALWKGSMPRAPLLRVRHG